MLTSDPIYSKPYKPLIRIDESDEPGNDYWQWDPITTAVIDGPTNCIPLHCAVSLSENNWGTFTIQILDQNMELDTYRLSQGAHVRIACGKKPDTLGTTSLISGIIKKAGHSRGADSKIVYNIFGSSAGIRLNERIIYFVNQAAKLAVDGMSPDLSDSTRLARTLLSSAIASELQYGILNDNLASSEVMAKIYDIAVEYGEMMDVASIVEEASGGDVSVDTLDRVNLTYNIRNVTGADIRPLYGFTVKNKKAANDDADDTCYFRGKTWSYEESSYKADSYSSRIYSILPTETDPTLEDISVYTQAGTPPGEMAQKFKPPHSHFLSGDVWCGLSQRADDGIARSEVFRIAGPDTANTPAQLNVIANLIFQKPGLSWPTGTLFSDLSISNDYVMLDSTGASIDSFDLDTTKFYWLINAQVNYHIGTFPIYYARSTRRTSLTGATKWETPNAGESTNAVSSGALNGWAASGDTHPLWFSMPRRRSLSIVMWDPKAMNNYGYGVPTTGGFPVDSLLPAAPSFIKTKDQWYKWMQFQFYDMVKPRSNFSLPKVSAPNIPILPGDILILNDSVLGWSGPGNEPIICRQGDIKYQWSEFDGGGKRNQSESVLTLNPVGLPARYK